MKWSRRSEGALEYGEDPIPAMLRRLRRIHPTLYPVRLQRRARADGSFGGCDVKIRGGRPVLLIDINPTLSFVSQMFVLTHEYAHAMQWRAEHQEDERDYAHDAEFGICWAQVWTALDEEDNEDGG